MSTYNKNAPSDYDGIFQKAADSHGVSYDLLRKLSFNESSFNPKAVSKTGPKGIMQFTRNTARAMGLNVTDGDDDGRYNPELAIDAGAKLLASLVKKYNGDELKAALAYNQGEGPAGTPQLQAYDKGDFGSISEEGRNYMRKLLDVAKSPNSGALEAFGGITPKGKGIPAEDAFKGIAKSGKVGTELPESHGFDIEGVAQEAPSTPYAKDFWEKTGTTLDEYNARSTFFGFGDAAEAQIQNSTLGVAFRAARADDGYDVFKDTMTPTRWNSYVPSKEDLQKLRDSGLPPSYYGVVTGGDGENWDALIKLAKDNFEADQRAAEAGTGAKLAAGIVGAGVDPLSYVPLVGVAGKGLKVVNKALRVGAQAGALSVASEGIRTSVAGGEAHYADAALGGLLFGAGMSALSDAVAAGIRKARGVESVNEFAAPALRMEARETAINTGGHDTSTLPPENFSFEQDHRGVPFADHPTEEGAVVLANGSILSDTNPLNPRTQRDFAEIDPERAAPGIKLGGFTEIGLKTLGSKDAGVRAIAQDLVRSPTGMQSGSSGKFGATASDIHERLHATDQRMYNQLYDAVDRAMKDPEFSVGEQKMSRRAIRQEVYKRAALAIERPELQADLTKGEREVMDLLKEHFDTKRELMEQPGIFGNANAVSIFPGSRHKGTYVPNVYDRGAKELMIQKLGGPEGLQQAIAQSWLTSYRVRPEVKARVDEYLMELNGYKSVDQVTPEVVQKHAMDKAYGISHTEDFTASSVIDDNITGLVGIENNSFLEARNMFDSDLPVTLPDGSTFSVNDLRDFDMARIIPAYDRRVNGDISIMGGSGKTTQQLKDEIMALDKRAERKGQLKGEVEALKDTVKILTGRARRNNDTAFETAMRTLNDLAFFAKNFYMGPQNLTEIAGMLAKGNVKAMLHGIPTLRDLATRTSPVSGSELRELHGALFGKELDQLIRPGREDIVQRIREASDTSGAMASVIGTIKFGTQELSARSPWTKMLNGTANYILDTARQGVLGDVAGAALGGKGSKFGKENFLKAASISPEQWKGIKQLFVDHATRDANGQFTIKDKKAFSQDPRAMDLWRLADKVADETMLRPHKVSQQDSKAYGAGVKMAMQFKNFTIKSLNAKFIRSFYEGYKNNRAIDMALTHVLSLGIAGTYFAMQAHVKAYGLQESQRKDYLKKALNPTMLGYAALTRSSHTGAPLSIVSMMAGAAGFQDANMLRSTILPKEEQFQKKDGASKGRAESSNLAGNLGSQVPALGYVGNVIATAKNAYGVATAPNKPTERDYMTGLMNSTKELVPNDPLTQQLIMKIYEANGVTIKQQPKPN
ncbi:membrane-bound lytic murein transglycosylase F [Klebsiella phage 066045]|uniref:Peptidoglycan transglycosylase gp16 n=1 Tax=Klebsiella phage 066022 TaxID=2777385 RepID=A0A7S6U203_9CAUD|nr:membrane-bound lytic murein transglycosylase F [Klebsiella phage 066022]QOV06753.1 membrane-bound lytic murein transglycosylase F [Klebsiella phage 066026]QOV06918.1 membrane-bound lytic murein transglycosylase F [Klebsiella phage 066031]QOV07126.1 membrane-bound lytic murein transglycosylase F [Klebsiella phage 066038]QOV07346.1 membrane-bound lytic murein transglycosylase F [Klebsiella phage 066045]QOV07695.1 membrane-bound lytic murein transglycosylase F [Klebsiella phage 066134]